MRSLLKVVSQSVKDVLFPPKCRVCLSFLNRTEPDLSSRRVSGEGEGAPLILSHVFETLMQPYLCPVCIDGFFTIASPLCTYCGKMFAGRQGEDHICGECLKKKKKYNRARSVGVYEGTLLALIHQFKYHGRVELARPLGELLYHAYVRHWGSEAVDMIIPVPLHARKLRQRGFNQAQLLLNAWKGRVSNQKDGPSVNIWSDILRRIRWTAPQTGLGRRERQQNLKGAFRLIRPERVENREVLLVDDVLTTGATVTECARVLIAGGAKRVDVLTLARAI